MENNNHVLIEIGLEELPARFIDDAIKQLQTKVQDWLQLERIEYEKTSIFSTPRRLAILIENVAATQQPKTIEIRGPQLKIARDETGNWTNAAKGFTNGQGKTPDDIYIKKVKGNEYVFIEKTLETSKTETILPNVKQIIESLSFPQMMRWGSSTFRYARPIRWILALYNHQVIPMEIANVKSGNMTSGHRFLGKQVRITNPLEYESKLEKQYVIANPQKRKSIILLGIKELEKKEGFHVIPDETLLQEICNLVEYPTVFFGSFDKEYLQVPKEVLITSMKEHQRYFPVWDESGSALKPYFIGVRNGNSTAIDSVRKGNEKVLKARLADAAFFYNADKNQSIAFYMEKLKTVIFQEDIGTIYEKTVHVSQIAQKLAKRLQMDMDVQKRTARAADICKFDLMTDMVHEFTELQGIMGEKYASHFGEDRIVATAIREHYLPGQAAGNLPETEEGAIISVADKIDTIVSCFSVGLLPTGSQDPLGLRRQAIGILRIMAERKWEIPFEEVVQFATSIYQLDAPQHKALQQFFKDRATFILSAENIDHDIGEAILGEQIGVFFYAIKKAKLLMLKKYDANFKEHQEALVRIINVSKGQKTRKIDETLLETKTETILYRNFKNLKTSFENAEQNFDSAAALGQLVHLSKPIHDFFAFNMVMADDEAVRKNRLSLVGQITKLIKEFADLSIIEWKQHNA